MRILKNLMQSVSNKQIAESFYQEEYANLNGMLKRIKEQEPKWFSTLLLIHGAIMAFAVSVDLSSNGQYFGKERYISLLQFEFNNLEIFLAAYTMILVLASFIWGLVALNLRLQFYRARIDIAELKWKLGLSNDIYKWQEMGFTHWRKTVTAPFETVFHYFLLMGALNMVSLILIVLRVLFNTGLFEEVFLGVAFGLFGLSIIFYIIIDRQKLSAFYSKKFKDNPYTRIKQS